MKQKETLYFSICVIRLKYEVLVYEFNSFAVIQLHVTTQESISLTQSLLICYNMLFQWVDLT